MRYIFAFLGMFLSFHVCAETLTLARQEKSHIADSAQPVIECALSEIRQPYKIVIVPWKRAQAGTQHHKYGGFFVAAETPGRNKYATRSVGVLSNDWLFVQSGRDVLSPDNHAFWAQSFVSNLGTAKLKWLIQQQSDGRLQGEVVSAPTLNGAWHQFIQGRANVLLENEINFMKLLKAEKAAIPLDIKVARKVSQGVYISNRFLALNEGFLDRFNAALKICKTSVRKRERQLARK